MRASISRERARLAVIKLMGGELVVGRCGGGRWFRLIIYALRGLPSARMDCAMSCTGAAGRRRGED